MLNIEDLHVEVDGKEILHGLDLRVPPGEVHAVMGPNGSARARSPTHWQVARAMR
jgi:Fe-S cluster assembly ATP-binding protein